MRAARRRGAGALEFALTLPVLLLVLAGIIELSLLMQRTHVVTRAARDACRTGAGIVEGAEPTGELIFAAAEEQARLSLQAAGIPCGDDCEIDSDWFEEDGWWMLRVTVAVPYRPITGLLDLVPTTTASDFVMLTRQQGPPVEP